MLGKGVRDYIRKMTRRTLTERCAIEKEVVTQAASFTSIRVWQAVASNVPCRLILAGTTTQDESEAFAAQDAIEERYQLIVAWDGTLEVDMRIVLGGIAYYVVQLNTALTDAAFLSAIVTRKRGADG